MIITDRSQIDNKKYLAFTSVGGSPITIGHTRLIRDCKPKVLEWLHTDETNGDVFARLEDIHLLVIVNCDDWLRRKHRFSFQNENERAEILDSIKDVDYTFVFQSDKQTIEDALEYFQPDFFLKGGDRSKIESIPVSEINACEKCDCKIIFGCGGFDKISSSSELIKGAVEFFNTKW